MSNAWLSAPMSSDKFNACMRGSAALTRVTEWIENPMGFRGVWLTPGAAVNRRVWAGMGRDLQKGPAEYSLSSVSADGREFAVANVGCADGVFLSPLARSSR
jgi:hypothetical protein